MHLINQMIPLSLNHQGGDPNFFRFVGGLAGSPVVHDIFQHAIGRSYEGRILLCANRIHRERRFPPFVEPGDRADFLDSLGWNSAEPTCAHVVAGGLTIGSGPAEGWWGLQSVAYRTSLFTLSLFAVV